MGIYKVIIEKLLYQQRALRYYCSLVRTGIMVLLNEGWHGFFRRLSIWLEMLRATTERPTDLPEVIDRVSGGKAGKVTFDRFSQQSEKSAVMPGTGQHLLFIDSSVPTYDKDGGSLTTYSYLRLFLDMGFRITFIPDNRLKLMPYTRELQRLGIEVLYGHFDFDRWLKENGKNIDLVWLTRPETSKKYIDRIRQESNARILYYTQDLHYLREQRRYLVEQDKRALAVAERLKQLEFSIFSKVDVVLTPSNIEREIISKELPDKRTEVIPACFLFEGPADEIVPFHLRKDILFLGGFGHIPNVDAALFLVKEIFPLIRKQLPHVCLYIVGSNPPRQVLKLQSRYIVVTGYVADLAPFFSSCKVFVAPIRYGAGVKVKNIISMSHGLPVVTTTVGAEGLGLSDGVNVLIADTPDEFADRVVSLYNSETLWTKLALGALEAVKRNFSYELARDIIKDLIS